jgi:flagellar motor switch protein FliM
VALSDLLALEIGDVIPLGTSADRGVTLWVAESPCAGALLGSRDGKLAVRLTSSTPATENES